MGITNFVLINHNIKNPIVRTLKQEISKDREERDNTQGFTLVHFTMIPTQS
jgi:hypothetical protein